MSKLLDHQWYWTYNSVFKCRGRTPRKWRCGKWVGVRNDNQHLIEVCTNNGIPIQIKEPSKNNT